MIYMFIFVMLKIVFENGQYYNEQIKLGFRMNEICFGSMFNAHTFISHGGERGGSVVECRTPEREVRGSRPTAAVLCP